MIRNGSDAGPASLRDCAYLVAPPRLGLVKCNVGLFEQRLQALSHSKLTNAETGSHPVQVAHYLQRIAVKQLPQTFGLLDSIGPRGIRQQYQEFLATPARYNILFTSRFFKCSRQRNQHVIANVMPEVIVDIFEKIYSRIYF